MYITLVLKNWGIPKMLVLCNFLKILMVSDNSIHNDCRTVQLYEQNPLEKFIIFTVYQNYTLALRIMHFDKSV